MSTVFPGLALAPNGSGPERGEGLRRFEEPRGPSGASYEIRRSRLRMEKIALKDVVDGLEMQSDTMTAYLD
jgi:hypothetical protein